MNLSSLARRTSVVAIVVLTLVRLPSLVQPPGADQELYAYVAQEIHRGGLPYVDAWDQKPPGIHYTYALMFAIWPDERVIAATDLAAATSVALLLLMLGRRLAPGAGELAAVLFLLFGNPAFARLGGIRVRAQCETFVALAVTAALLLVYSLAQLPESERRIRRWTLGLLAGALLGVAFVYKYNTVVYSAAAAVALVVWTHSRRAGRTSSLRTTVSDLAAMAVGFLLPVGAMLTVFGSGPSWNALWDATVAYNLQYSRETYTSATGAAWYLMTMPIQQARVNALWLLGGSGCLVLLAFSQRHASLLAAPIWVAAACLSIVINGSRSLPQYFIQADPALALAAGAGAVVVARALTTRVVRLGVLVVVVLATARVSAFAKAVDYTWWDVQCLAGTIDRETYLARFGGQRAEDKHSPLAVAHLAGYLGTHSRPDDRVLVFGFSPGALVQSSRRSASRFFWSRPLVVGFNEGKPGYGASELLRNVQATSPAVVVLQQNDWQMEGQDSATYFLGTPNLAAWLSAHYQRQPDLHNYLLWTRRQP